jgi:hypothetical protein
MKQARKGWGAQRQSECGGKKRYRTWEQASLTRRTRMTYGADDLRIYECRFCAGFHLTKQRVKDAI